MFVHVGTFELTPSKAWEVYLENNPANNRDSQETILRMGFKLVSCSRTAPNSMGLTRTTILPGFTGSNLPVMKAVEARYGNRKRLVHASRCFVVVPICLRIRVRDWLGL